MRGGNYHYEMAERTRALPFGGLGAMRQLPGKSQQACRLVVARKNLSVERGEQALFGDVRYFFYITNARAWEARGIVFSANQR